MATTVSAPSASATPPQAAGGETHENNVLSAGLARCRKWLRNQKDAGVLGYPSTTSTSLRATGTADRPALQGSTADFAPSICTNSDSSIAAASSANHSNSAITSATTAASAAAYHPPGTSGPLLHLMNSRWAGCLAPTLSSRSLTSGARQSAVLRTRTSALVGATGATEGPSRTTSILVGPHSIACVPSQQQQQQRTGTSHSTTSTHSACHNAHIRPTGPDIGLSVPTAITEIESVYHARRPSHSCTPGMAPLPLSPISASPPLSHSSAVLGPELPVYYATLPWNNTEIELEEEYAGQENIAEPGPATPRTSLDNNGNQSNNGHYGLARPSSLLFCECTPDGPLHSHMHHLSRPRHHHRSYASSMTGSFSGNISAAEDDDDDDEDNAVPVNNSSTGSSRNGGSHSLARIDEVAASFGIGPFGSPTINGIHDSAYASVGLAGGDEQPMYASESTITAATNQQIAPLVTQSPDYPRHPGYGTAPSPPTAGGSSAAAIVSIFSIGQPAHPHKRLIKRLARVRRLSRRLVGALARVLNLGRRRQSTDSSAYASRRVVSDSDQACSDALVAAFSAEASLMASTQLLERMRSMQTMSFRVRADRVHLAQGQVLHCVYILFTQQVRAERRQSRHYRFYLPEDDQAELDRGFSESVLFAAQALSRGFQIRGTEMYTQALREPAWMLCSAWAALRHVLHVRGQDLWRAWTRGTGRVSGRDSRDPAQLDEIAALREVLEDFDEAWVRFERDLCFAYFGLSNAQIAGIMDPNNSGDALAPESQRIAQEEEFSLLVVLMSETLQRCLILGLATRDQMECMDPVL
ncbi:hypothetical protein LPJ81_005225, partial [Coemansia sp. IMI 209127]